MIVAKSITVTAAKIVIAAGVTIVALSGAMIGAVARGAHPVAIPAPRGIQPRQAHVATITSGDVMATTGLSPTVPQLQQQERNMWSVEGLPPRGLRLSDCRKTAAATIAKDRLL